jgi:hypothetical protein
MPSWNVSSWAGVRPASSTTSPRRTIIRSRAARDAGETLGPSRACAPSVVEARDRGSKSVGGSSRRNPSQGRRRPVMTATAIKHPCVRRWPRKSPEAGGPGAGRRTGVRETIMVGESASAARGLISLRYNNAGVYYTFRPTSIIAMSSKPLLFYQPRNRRNLASRAFSARRYLGCLPVPELASKVIDHRS